jgi:hypothetical protein
MFRVSPAIAGELDPNNAQAKAQLQQLKGGAQ